jgi:Na+/H+ antiporter NhaD/arsenite permease-like protein
VNIVGVLIFAVVYLLISARRIGHLGLDRPAAVLLGAVATVGLGVLTPGQALGSVELGTLLLLLSVMGVGAFLMIEGLFDAAELALDRRAQGPGALLAAVVWGAGLLSALITNDAVCLLAAPLVLRVAARRGWPTAPFAIALATGANTGSVATLVGNPQNMLCAQLGGLDYLDYLGVAGPLALAGLALNHGILAWVYRRALAGAPRVAVRPGSAAAPLRRRHALTLGVVGGGALVAALGAPLPWAAAGTFVSLLLLLRRDPRQVWLHVDWSLLLFFAGLFVVVEGFGRSGGAAALMGWGPIAALADGSAGLPGVAALYLLGSNLVSNVPFILLIQEQVRAAADPQAAWSLLAIVSTFAGNSSLLGSAANVIVAEAARDHGGFGFFEHLKVGLPLSLLSCALAVLWLLALS